MSHFLFLFSMHRYRSVGKRQSTGSMPSWFIYILMFCFCSLPFFAFFPIVVGSAASIDVTQYEQHKRYLRVGPSSCVSVAHLNIRMYSFPHTHILSSTSLSSAQYTPLELSQYHQTVRSPLIVLVTPPFVPHFVRHCHSCSSKSCLIAHQIKMTFDGMKRT